MFNIKWFDWVSTMLFRHVFFKTISRKISGYLNTVAKGNTIFSFQPSFVQHKTAPTHGER